MKNLLFILLLILPFVGYSQQQSEKVSFAGKVYTSVDVMPEFPGGEDEMYKYFSKNIKYPKDARRKKIQGKVFLNFVVSEVGEITEVKVLRRLYKSIDEEALRVIRNMPNWKPGTQNGRAVRVSFNVPLNFTLK